jgi:hypothetical protein
MTQWPIDYKKVAPATGLELMLQPANDVINWWFDYMVWIMVQNYFAPYRMPENLGDVEKWTRSVSLNGIKPFNLCQR